MSSGGGNDSCFGCGGNSVLAAEAVFRLRLSCFGSDMSGSVSAAAALFCLFRRRLNEAAVATTETKWRLLEWWP